MRQVIPRPDERPREQGCLKRERWVTDLRCHDVSAQQAGRARPTVAGRIPMRCIPPVEQTGQIRRDRPVSASYRSCESASEASTRGGGGGASRSWRQRASLLSLSCCR